MKEQIVDQVVDKYINSKDFNGLPYRILRGRLNLKEDFLINLLKELLENDQIEIVYGDYHPNPHIKAFSDMDKHQQISKIINHKLLNMACLYPHKNVLKNNPQIAKSYLDKPYSKELALGAGQLDFRAFDLSVLEIYRNDPRYHYDNNDISGFISVRHEYYESSEISESDKILLNTFGFCYNNNFDRAVAVFVIYLSYLTPEHQQIWKTKELIGKYKLHPDYYLNSIIGEFGTGLSIFEAFIMELDIINKMCSLMRKPPLFKETFKNSRPRGFGFLLRPTLGEFNSFVHLLDKMISDNLNRDFFKGDIALETEKRRADGKIVVTQKGTIMLLKEWIKKFFRTKEYGIIDEMFMAFKQLRGIRQKPAHFINEDEFDQKYFKEQRALIKRVYTALRDLRLIIANHSSVKSNPPDIDNLLYEGKIWDI